MRRPMTEIARIRLRRVIVAALLTVAEAACAGQEIPPEQPPVLASFSASAIANGATLAALGDCAVCHTAPDGSPYAGGQGIQTPFGTVYATNITPDPTTGIGQWTLDAFRRAMRDGIDREGRHLYPVLPYPHFIHATDDDIAAMYAFLMTREPVTRQAPKNHLTFPFNWRPLLAAWNAWFLRPGIWQPDAAHDAEWNRGAYLVDAIGHCGACHTPHNAAGAEQRGQTLAGGEAEGWFAPALATNSQAPVPWSVDALTGYLRTGFDAGHGAAAGPMALVTHQLAAVPDTDVRAMAVYIGSLMPPKPAGAEAAPAGRGSPNNRHLRWRLWGLPRRRRANDQEWCSLTRAQHGDQCAGLTQRCRRDPARAAVARRSCRTLHAPIFRLTDGRAGRQPRRLCPGTLHSSPTLAGHRCHGA